MKRVCRAILVISATASPAFAQNLNKIVFGPLEGDDAGVLTVQNGEAIEIEIWVRTDSDNPAPVVAVAHGLLSEDAIIAERHGARIEPEYDEQWAYCFVDGPFVHDPDANFPIPEGYTCEMQIALCSIFGDCPFPLDTQGDWDYYGAFLMTCNTGVAVDSTYYPLSEGWYPRNGQGTSWMFEIPPGGEVEPVQDFGGLYFAPECDYVLFDCNHNGVPGELGDVVTMISYYRGTSQPAYTCYCPPHGEDFPPDADPDGNCVPFEMSDVLIMLGWPPMWPHGCLDCPPPGGLLGGKGGNTELVPTLKSKVRIERKQIQNKGVE